MVPSTSAEPPHWLTDPEEATWRSLVRMQAKLAVLLNRDLARHGDLSLQDYAVLVALTDRPDGRLRAYELVEELGWEKSRLSHHVDRMARRGLVTRERCPSDQRGLYVTVTSHGRDAQAAAAPGHVETVRHALVDVLSPGQLAALDDVCRTVLDGLATSEAGERHPVPPAA